MLIQVPEENPAQLGGWFDGFCPSNGIADNLNRKAKSVWAKHVNAEKKLEELKRGPQANEWQAQKAILAKLEKEIKKEQLVLNQEKAIAEALGIQGLGAWCNGAVSRRRRAEVSLRNAEKALGEAKGAFEILERQQKEGLYNVGRSITKSKKTLNVLKSKIQDIKNKVARYKSERIKERKQKELAAKQNVQNVSASSKLLSKKNLPFVIGGVAIATGIAVYAFGKTKNKKK